MGLVRAILAMIAGVIALMLLLPLFALVFPFWFVSLLTRGISDLLEPRFLTRDELIQFDPVFGWKARPNLDTHHLMVDLFHITTDADGWRGRASLEESHIVVFGDSFAAGYGVSDRHFYANLERSPRIKPIGIGGYSMVQEFLWIKQLAPRLKGKLVIWFIYHGNDLYDNLMPDLRGFRKPFVRERGNWEIVSSHITPEKWPIITQGRMQGENHMPRLAELCADTFLAKRAYSACEYLIGEGSQVCSEAEAQLFVMTIPDAYQLTPEGQRGLKALGGEMDSFDPNRPDKQLKAICQRMNIGFLGGSSFLDSSCYKTNDCHWNEKGHRRVFEALSRLHEEHQSRSGIYTPKIADTMAQV